MRHVVAFTSPCQRVGQCATCSRRRGGRWAGTGSNSPSRFRFSVRSGATRRSATQVGSSRGRPRTREVSRGTLEMPEFAGTAPEVRADAAESKRSAWRNDRRGPRRVLLASTTQRTGRPTVQQQAGPTTATKSSGLRTDGSNPAPVGDVPSTGHGSDWSRVLNMFHVKRSGPTYRVDLRSPPAVGTCSRHRPVHGGDRGRPATWRPTDLPTADR